jgi:hypothetical protein
MSDIIMSARERLLRKQIENAWKMSGIYRARGDLDQSWVHQNWTMDAEIELQEMWRKGGRA